MLGDNHVFSLLHKENQPLIRGALAIFIGKEYLETNILGVLPFIFEVNFSLKEDSRISFFFFSCRMLYMVFHYILAHIVFGERLMLVFFHYCSPLSSECFLFFFWLLLTLSTYLWFSTIICYGMVFLSVSFQWFIRFCVCGFVVFISFRKILANLLSVFLLFIFWYSTEYVLDHLIFTVPWTIETLFLFSFFFYFLRLFLSVLQFEKFLLGCLQVYQSFILLWTPVNFFSSQTL